MLKTTIASAAAAIAVLVGAAVSAQAQRPQPTSAQWLDWLCMTSHVSSNDIAVLEAEFCHTILTATWNTALDTARITGKQLICSTTPIVAEQKELIFSNYARAHARDPAFGASYTAEAWALAAFMEAYPCR
jgi:hypothetical protein